MPAECIRRARWDQSSREAEGTLLLPGSAQAPHSKQRSLLRTVSPSRPSPRHPRSTEEEETRIA